ncbi:T5orf172 domain-containing protein [Salsuginibacillus halophilus]|uniref:T5orf172 domain-containing protein n=1 Tax=Salsuginibacillus halophilus TaxID=517424 RepID=A0A2P8H8P2_9BACI|nr:DUF4041 domain-containing protein [Salsuginibacillus halophilus]PSL42561.1 T5orf172 domain-containing protein [Salsuginibacillus halophilus]
MTKKKWYLSAWHISIWFALSFLIIPFFVGLGLLIWQIIDERKRNKDIKELGLHDLQRVNEEKLKLEKQMEKTKSNAEKSAEKKIAEAEKEAKAITANVDKRLEKLNDQVTQLESQEAKLEDEIKAKKMQLSHLDEDLMMQTVGLYDPQYDFTTTEGYKEKLKEVRQNQKEMVKAGTALNKPQGWKVNGSEKEGKKFIKNMEKMTLNAFNQECTALISNVKTTNLEATKEKMKKKYEQLNKLNELNRISIQERYLASKLDEMYLAYEHALKKEEEKEQERIMKEQLKEEKRIQQEIEKEKKKLDKDLQHLSQAKETYEKQLASVDDDETREEILAKMKEIEEKQEELHSEKEVVDFREQNAKAGYVYIISNIGSFGEDVYKIGMTRRLEPFERVKELSDASVPFNFDVHAMIFADNAPELENALHKEFEKYQVNKVNPRKEFFNVPLDIIVNKVKENHNKAIDVTEFPEAEDYRVSLRMAEEDKTAV